MAGSGAQIILQGQRPDVSVKSPYEISKENLTLRQQQQSVAENDLTLEKIKAQIAQSKQDAQEDFAAQQIVNDPNLDTPTKLQKLGGVSNRIASTVGARLLKESQAGQAEDIQRAQLSQGQMAPEVKTPGPVIQGAQLPGYDPEQNGSGAVASAAPIQEAPTTQAVAIPPQDMEIRGALSPGFKVPVQSKQQQIAEAGRVSSLAEAKADMNARRTAAVEAAKIQETQKANQVTIHYRGDSFTGPKDLADNWYNAKATDDREQAARIDRDNEASRGREFQHGEGELTRQNARDIAATKAKAAAGDGPALEYNIAKTRSGMQYVDSSAFRSAKEADALTKAAQKAGIPVVNKDVGDMLHEIDTARDNLDYMNQTITPKLAKDAQGRPLRSLTNTIEKMAQTDPDLAAVGTYRSAAIQAMRAVAGAKGLRINRAEIEQAQENDIPKMTDTLPVAQAKLKNMNKFLDDVERNHLVQDRSQGAIPSGAPSSDTRTFKVIR